MVLNSFVVVVVEHFYFLLLGLQLILKVLDNGLILLDILRFLF
jgi:hypothetical protein